MEIKSIALFFALILFSSLSWGQTATVTQVNTGTVTQGTTEQEVIGISLTVGNINNKDVTQFDINELGTAIGGVDIVNAKIWCTDQIPTFSTTNLFGSQTVSGSFSISGIKTISKNTTTYFWLTFDVPAGATIGNTLDASCTNIVFNGGNITPTTTNPSGSREIVAAPVSAGKILFDGTSGQSDASADWVVDADAWNLDWYSSGDCHTTGTESNP